jgi:hypothetical protein
MAKEETADDGSGLGDVQITIVVVPGRVRVTLGKLRAGGRVGAGLASVGLVAAIAAGAITAVSSTSRAAGQPLKSRALAAQNGLGSSCAHRPVFSPDGASARVKLKRVSPCGTDGREVTLIMRRVRGVWVVP